MSLFGIVRRFIFYSTSGFFLLGHAIQASFGNPSLPMNSSKPLSRNVSRTTAGNLFSYRGSDYVYISGTMGLPVTSSSNALASSLPSPTPTYPATLKYKDPKLTGCYAGTGGSTIITLTSGDAIYGSPLILVGAEPQTLSYSCSDFFALDLKAWHISASFAESPACASYAKDFEEWQSPPYKPQVPGPLEYVPGVQNGDAHIPFLCCGGCKFGIPAVQALYWSTTTVDECFHSNATITSYVSSVAQSSQIPSFAGASQPQAAKFAVVDGSTLEFPSLYLAIHGAVSVYNKCGVRGDMHYNPTIAIPPGGLSTISWPGNVVQLAGYPPETGVFDPAACRTYGLDNGSTTSWLNGLSSWTTSVSYSMGPPYNPILLPPEQLTALDPQWEACTAWDNYGNDAYDVFFGLYDPPRALNVAPALVEPLTTSPDPTARQTSPAPQPAASISSTDPKITAKPPTDPSPSHTQAGSPDGESPDPGLAGFILQPFQGDPTKGVGGPALPTENIVSPNQNPPASPGPDAGTNRPDSNLPQDQDQGNIMPSQDPPTTSSGQNPVDSHLNPGLLLINPGQGLGDNSPGPSPAFITISNTPFYLPPPSTITSSGIRLISPNPLETTLPILEIDGAAYTANRDSQYIIDSQTISPGGPTVHINGFAYSLAPSTTPPPSIASIISAISSSKNGPVITINGKTYYADSASQYVVGSQTLTPGGPAITIGNVPYALPSSPTAIISGSSTIPLDPHRTPDPAVVSMLKAAGVIGDGPPQVYSVDGVTLTGGPNALKVGSTTLTPGSPPLTVSGHTFSLASAGLIVVDGHTSDLASQVYSVSPDDPHTYTADGIALTGDPTALVVGSTTLTPDSPPLTTSGHSLALKNGGLLIVDGHTRTLTSSPSITDVQIFTISGLALTENANDAVVVGSATLFPGSTPVTISGHALSLATGDGAAVVVIDGHASTLVPSTGSSGVAGATPGSGNDGDNIDLFAGAANRQGKEANGVLRAVVLLLMAWITSDFVF